jgi:hypothetical protein
LFKLASTNGKISGKEETLKDDDPLVHLNHGQQDDLQSIDGLLSAWVALLQQTNTNPILEQKANQEGIEALGEWVQQAYPTMKVPANPNELLQGLTKQFQSLDVPTEILEKINLLMEKIDRHSISSSIEKNESIFLGENNQNPDKKNLTQPITGLPKWNGFANVTGYFDPNPHLSKDNKPFILDKNAVPPLSTINLMNPSQDNRNQSTSKFVSIVGKDQIGFVPPSLLMSNSFQMNQEPVLPPELPMARFTPEVSEWIVRQFKVSNGDFETTEAKLSLFPEHLGQLDIKVTSQQGQISAQFITDSLLGKEALEGKIHDLTHALQQQGLTVNKVDVIYQTPPTADSSQTNFSFSDGGSNFSQDQSSYSHRHSRKEIEQEKSDLEKETASITYGYSHRSIVGSIDYTA